MTTVQEKLWVKELEGWIHSNYQLEDGLAKVSYAHQYQFSTRDPMGLHFEHEAPIFQMNLPYTSWLNEVPSRLVEDQQAISVASLKAGHCLGALVRSELAEPFEAMANLSKTFTTHPIHQSYQTFVARRGTLEGFWPFAEMDDFVAQAATHYPSSRFIVAWDLHRDLLAEYWPTLPVLGWLLLTLGGKPAEMDWLVLIHDLCQLIGGTPLELIIHRG